MAMISKITVVGDYSWPWYQDAAINAFESLGITTLKFGWFDDFRMFPPGAVEPVYKSISARLQYKFRFGSILGRINQRFICEMEIFQPDMIFFYNCNHIHANSVKTIQKSLSKVKIVTYANDDPFSTYYPGYFWRNFKSLIPLSDLAAAFRPANLAQLQEAGAKRTWLMPPYFITEFDQPMPREKVPGEFHSDVVFVGHYEDDGRLDLLRAVYNSGFDLKVFGGGWSDAKHQVEPGSDFAQLLNCEPAVGERYRHAICGANVALCFLSKLNRDVYTRRNFQIPAMQTALLSEYTPELAELFEEGREIEFFRSEDELLAKLKMLLLSDESRRTLALNARLRVVEDGHDVVSRMQALLAELSN